LIGARTLATGFLGEVVVADGDVDSAVEGRIEGLDSVGGEEEHALVVLQLPQEDAHHRVTQHVDVRPPLQENLRMR
jgi:hypothetical protein